MSPLKKNSKKATFLELNDEPLLQNFEKFFIENSIITYRFIQNLFLRLIATKNVAFLEFFIFNGEIKSSKIFLHRKLV